MSPESRRFARLVGFLTAGTLMLGGVGSARTSAILAVLLSLAGLALVLALVPHLFSSRTRLVLAALTVVLLVGSAFTAPARQPRVTAQPTPTIVGAAKAAATLTAISEPQQAATPLPATATSQVLTPAPTSAAIPPTPPPPTEVVQAEPTAEPASAPPTSALIHAKPVAPAVAAKPLGASGSGSGPSEQRPASGPTPKPSALGVAPASRTACPASHPIKGNQGSRSNVDWIYHVPGSNSYNATQPDRCFATEEEARAAGYRAPLR